MSDAPVRGIDRLFDALAHAYGRRFMGLWDGLNVEDVKADWVARLRGIHGPSIAWALENLDPDQAPNALQFRALCRRAPVRGAARIEGPSGSEEARAAGLAALRAIRARRGSVPEPAPLLLPQPSDPVSFTSGVGDGDLGAADLSSVDSILSPKPAAAVVDRLIEIGRSRGLTLFQASVLRELAPRVVEDAVVVEGSEVVSA